MFEDLLKTLKGGAGNLLNKVFPSETVTVYADKPQETPYPENTIIGGADYSGLPPNKGYMPKPVASAPTPTLPPDDTALPYYEHINATSKLNNLPGDILYKLLRKESMGFNPDVIGGITNSPKGAQGIAQFMPETSQWLGIDPLNPQEAISGSGRYLADQLKTFGDIELALAAYNAGPGNVRKYGGVPPFEETQNYVNDILGIE